MFDKGLYTKRHPLAPPGLYPIVQTGIITVGKENINQISSLQAAGCSFKLCIKRPYLVQESTLGSRGSRTHIGDGAKHEFEICRCGFNSCGAVLIALEGEFKAVKGVVDGGS
jgi:hypothetical protein